MANYLIMLLILSGFTGIISITTVSKVSVKQRGSISIPCLYEPMYQGNVKYLCNGYFFSSCSYAVKTNKPDKSKKYLISDNTNQNIFTVTINDLNADDTHYWCVVEINNGKDIGTYFHLYVQDVSKLYVAQQEITGYNGGNITVKCHHDSSKNMKWCRLGSLSCLGHSESICSTSVIINTSVPKVFTVTMGSLTTQSDGWFLCDNGYFQMPVNITVKSTTTPTSTTKTQLSSTKHQSNYSQGPEPDEQRRWRKLPNVIIVTVLLAFAVTGTLIIWWVLKQHEKAKRETQLGQMEITYSDVMNISKKTPGQMSVVKSDDVTYSTVATKHLRTTQKQNDVIYSIPIIVNNPNTQQEVEQKSESVIYSNLGRRQK